MHLISKIGCIYDFSVYLVKIYFVYFLKDLPIYLIFILGVELNEIILLNLKLMLYKLII